MAQSPEAMAAAMVANMKEKTGRALEQWVKLAAKAELEKHGQVVNHLKSEHGLTHGYANLVAHTLLKSAASTSGETADDLVEAQYAGPKAGLKPIYNAIIAATNKLGKDVELAPKKAYVSLRRNKQFGLVQPSTKARVDLGLNLKGHPTTDRLEASGSFNSMCTHRVRLESVKDVNAELKGWIKAAYDAG